MQHGANEHIRNAQRNRSLATVIDGERESFRDWLATVYFYVIIHLVEACLAAKQTHSRNHQHRRELVGRYMGDEWEEEYERLLIRTRAYRYECEYPSETELHDLLSRTVEPFMQYLCRKLHSGEAADRLLKEMQPF
jgi:uncharacterized protein (UPF0332 family)